MLSGLTLASMIAYATPLWNEVQTLVLICAGAAIAVMIMRFGVKYVKKAR